LELAAASVALAADSPAPGSQFKSFLRLWRQLKEAEAENQREQAEVEELAETKDEARKRIEALEEQQGHLFREERRLAQSVALITATDLAGVAFKLILWRDGVAEEGPCGVYQPWDVFAFSAYRDLLRLAGMMKYAHVDDAETMDFIIDPEGYTSPNYMAKF
jgi:hypothetical protein